MNCGIEVLKRLNELIDTELKEVICRCEKKIGENGLCMSDLFEELNLVLPCQAVSSLHLIKKHRILLLSALIIMAIMCWSRMFKRR